MSPPDVTDSESPPAPSREGVPVLHAKLVKIYISAGHDYWGRQGEGRLQHGIQDVQEVECLPDRGLRGDRYSLKKPGHKAQVTFFSAEVFEQIRDQFKLPRLPASVFRRNLIVQGASLQDWLGKRFLFQGIEFEGTQECKPCDWMNRSITEGAEAYLKQEFRGGLRAKIITAGRLHVG